MDIEGCNLYLSMFGDLNFGADHNCTYEIQLLPEAPSLDLSLAGHFSSRSTSLMSPQDAERWHIRVHPMNADWLSKVKPIVRRWFFEISYSPKFEERQKDIFVEGMLEQIHRLAGTGSAYEVFTAPPMWYESQWDDIAIVADGRRFLLHFGCSD